MAKKMESQPSWGLKITFDEGRSYPQGLKIPFKKITSLLEKCNQGCVHNLGLTNPGNWLLSIPNYTISSLTLVSSLAAFTRSSVRSA